jgi:hypothetical protein
MIINLSGLAGHCMPMDLNIEHLIGFLKVPLPIQPETLHSLIFS